MPNTTKVHELIHFTCEVCTEIDMVSDWLHFLETVPGNLEASSAFHGTV